MTGFSFTRERKIICSNIVTVTKSLTMQYSLALALTWQPFMPLIMFVKEKQYSRCRISSKIFKSVSLSSLEIL